MSQKNEIAAFSLCPTLFLKIVPPSGHYPQQKNSPRFLLAHKNVKMCPSTDRRDTIVCWEKSLAAQLCGQHLQNFSKNQRSFIWFAVDSLLIFTNYIADQFNISDWLFIFVNVIAQSIFELESLRGTGLWRGPGQSWTCSQCPFLHSRWKLGP